jgi:hypothetical protein
MVPIDIMNQQINLRLPGKLLNNASNYAKKNGFNNIQELIKETLREKLFPETTISKKELILIKKIVEATNKKGLWKSEDELFKVLDK